MHVCFHLGDYKKLSPDQHQDRASKCEDQNHLAVLLISYLSNDEDACYEADGKGWNQQGINLEALNSDVLPKKDLQWKFNKVDDQENPGSGSNETVLVYPHGQKIQVGKCPCQVAYHGGETRCQTR